MIRLLAQVTRLNATTPLDGPPDAFGGSALGTLVHRGLGVMKVAYSFAVNGGVVGLISLYDDLGNVAQLAPGTVVQRSFSNWTTALTSGGSATIAQGTGAAANDLKAATAVASYTGLLEGVPTGTAATAIALGATAAGYRVGITVAVADLTAGVGSIYIFYVF